MIPVIFSGEDNLPFVEVVVFVPGVTPAASLVRLMVDTGSTTTVVHPYDSRAVLNVPAGRLRPETWARWEIAVGINGESNMGVFDAIYAFFHEDGRTEIVEGEVRLVEPMAHNQDVPSLMGWDLLSKFELHSLGQQSMTLNPL